MIENRLNNEGWKNRDEWWRIRVGEEGGVREHMRQYWNEKEVINRGKRLKSNCYAVRWRVKGRKNRAGVGKKVVILPPEKYERKALDIKKRL